MEKKDEVRLSKFLSLVLRHDPAIANLKLDDAGWVSIADLLDGVRATGRNLSREELNTIVRNNSKQRFAISEDGLMIRASQGHSVNVELGYKPVQPPDILFHGTAERYLKSISQQGLVKGQRHHVHLSKSKDTASSVGKRHGKLVLLEVDAAAMFRDGFDFFISANEVWLTEHVPVQYIIFP